MISQFSPVEKLKKFEGQFGEALRRGIERAHVHRPR